MFLISKGLCTFGWSLSQGDQDPEEVYFEIMTSWLHFSLLIKCLLVNKYMGMKYWYELQLLKYVWMKSVQSDTWYDRTNYTVYWSVTA